MQFPVFHSSFKEKIYLRLTFEGVKERSTWRQFSNIANFACKEQFKVYI